MEGSPTKKIQTQVGRQMDQVGMEVNVERHQLSVDPIIQIKIQLQMINQLCTMFPRQELWSQIVTIKTHL